MKIETCNKCGEEVIKDRKLDSNIWNCPSCGLEEYETEHSDIFSKSFFDDIDKEKFSDDALDKSDWRIGRLLYLMYINSFYNITYK